MSFITVNLENIAGLKKQLEILMMPNKEKRRLLRLVAYRLRGDCQRRVRRRIDINGNPFHPHPGHTKAEHSFDRVARFIGITHQTDNSIELGWKKSSSSRLAWKIHYGSTEYVNDEKITNDRIKGGDKACSLWQARQLVAYAYRQGGRKKARLATVRWLRGSLNADGKRVGFHMTYRKAAIILDDIQTRNFKKSRLVLGSDDVSKVKIPARSFLGATQTEINNYIDTIFDQMTKELQRGVR